MELDDEYNNFIILNLKTVFYITHVHYSGPNKTNLTYFHSIEWLSANLLHHRIPPKCTEYSLTEQFIGKSNAPTVFKSF